MFRHTRPTTVVSPARMFSTRSGRITSINALADPERLSQLGLNLREE